MTLAADADAVVERRPPPLAEYTDPVRARVPADAALGFELRARFPRGELIIMRGERLHSLMVHDPDLNTRIEEDRCEALGEVATAVLSGTVDRCEWVDGLAGAEDLEIELVNLSDATRDEALAVLRFALGDHGLARAVAETADAGLTPWAWHKAVDVPDALRDLGVQAFDFRLATMHVYELAFCERGARMLIADRWMVTLWGLPVGDEWVEYVGHHALPGHGGRDYPGRTDVGGTDGPARAARYLQDVHWHHAWVSNVLSARLEAWEGRFYGAATADTATAAGALADLQTELARAGAFLSQLRLAVRTMRRRASYPFFPDAVRAETAEMYERLSRDVRQHGADVRDGFALLTSVSSARQTQISAKRQETDSEFQSAVQLIAAIILVPTLVAGFYGANVLGLPGAQDSDGLIYMMVAAFLGALLTGAYLRWRPQPRDVWRRLRSPGRQA